MYWPFKEGLRPNVQKTNKVDGLFVIPFGPLIMKTVSPLDPHSLIARRNPGPWKKFCTILIFSISFDQKITSIYSKFCMPVSVPFNHLFVSYNKFVSQALLTYLAVILLPCIMFVNIYVLLLLHFIIIYVLFIGQQFCRYCYLQTLFSHVKHISYYLYVYCIFFLWHK